MRIRVLLVLLALAVGGCGYHLSGGEEDRLPGGVQVICIPMFANRTMEHFLENVVSNAVMQRFSRALHVEVVEDPQKADAVLEGVITNYHSGASSYYGSKDQIVEYKAEIECQATLRSTKDKRVIWKGGASWNQEYEASPDRVLEESREEQTQNEIARYLADELFNRLTENF